jgi:hypothetical protein
MHHYESGQSDEDYDAIPLNAHVYVKLLSQ